MKIFLATGMAFLLLVMPSAFAQTCTPKFVAMYCQSAGALAQTYDYGHSLLNIRSGGGTDTNMEPIYAAGCGFVSPPIEVKIVEKRDFRLKDGSAKLARIAFSLPLVRQVDKFSSEGEYKGKTKITHAQGWILQRELVCPGDTPIEIQSLIDQQVMYEGICVGRPDFKPQCEQSEALANELTQKGWCRADPHRTTLKWQKC